MNCCKNKTLLPQKTAGLFRIVFEIMVLCHHLYQPVSVVGRRINSLLGPIAVAGFLIISGYGVGKSYLKKGEAYLSNLLKKRIPHTYATIVVTNLFYLSFFFITKDSFKSVWGFVTSVLYLPISKDYVVLSNWVYFMADLLIYYVIFFVVMKIFKKKKKRLVFTAVTMLVMCAVIIVILTIINNQTGSSRYLRACVAFPVGLLLSKWDDVICQFLTTYKRLTFLGVLALAIIATGLSYNNRMYSEYFANTFFALSLIIHSFGGSVKGKYVDFLSKNVLYVYLVHEWAFKMIRYINRDIHFMVDMLIVIVFSVSVALLINCVKTLRERKIGVMNKKLGSVTKDAP